MTDFVKTKKGNDCTRCGHSKYDPITKVTACHRYPPKTIMVPGNISGQLQAVSQFPFVNDKMFCGEFKKIS